MTTLLDAGYYPIRPMGFPDTGTGPAVALPYEQDKAYLIHLKAGKQFSPPDSYKGDFTIISDPADKTRRYALIRPKPGESIEIDREKSEEITRLSVAPSITELQTLEYGLQKYGKEIDNVSIMVNDLGLPPGVSDHLDMLLPENYRALLDAAGKPNPVLVSERKGRNTVTKAANKQIKKIGKGITAETEYERTGFIVGYLERRQGNRAQDCESGYLVISSPSIIDESPRGKSGFAVALIRDTGGKGTVPSCGVFEAGKIDLCQEHGKDTDRIIAVYHTSDDNDIRYKNIDGAFIHAWLHPDSKLHYTHVTLSSQPGREVMEDDYPPQRLRDKNEMTYSELLSELTAKHSAITPLQNGHKVTLASPEEKNGPSAGAGRA